MTDDELAQPWLVFAVEGLARWCLDVRACDRDVTLWDRELLDLCAAWELGRVQPWDLAVLLNRRQRERKQLAWSWLMCGAVGLSRENAPGVASIAEVARSLRITVNGSRLRG